MKVSMIASGSKGNSCFIESGDVKILIDCGISYKRIEKFFIDNSIDMNIDALFITHEHVDHVSGLKMFGKKVGCPVYMTEGSMKGIAEKNKGDDNPIPYNDVRTVQNDSIISIGNLNIKLFRISHDVYDPVGFVISDGTTKLVYITDTGFIPQTYYEMLSDANIYVMETNHDPELLMACEKRPFETRLRILGDVGHMSNEDGLDFLAHVMGNNTKLVFYAHISEDCNLPNLIEEQAKKIWRMYDMDVSGVRFIYTSQIPTEVFEI